MSESDFELARLQKENSRLKLLCVGLALMIFILYQIADRPRLNVGYDDGSVQYSPGLWKSNESRIYVYYSNDMGSMAIGYYDEKHERLFDRAWVMRKDR